MDIYDFLHSELEKLNTLKALHQKYKSDVILGMSLESERASSKKPKTDSANPSEK